MRLRKDIKWTTDYEPQDGDQVTLNDGIIVVYGSINEHNFVCYARAIGSISRLVPDPEPPQGYRLATEEDRNGPKPKGCKMWIMECWMNSDNARVWAEEPYAVPLPDPEPKQPTSVECQVAYTEMIYLPRDVFKIGQTVIVTVKE